MTAEQRPASTPDELIAYARAEFRQGLNSLYSLASILTAIALTLPMISYLTIGGDYPLPHRSIHLSAAAVLLVVGLWTYNRPRLIGQEPLPAMALLLTFNVSLFLTIVTVPTQESVWSICFLLIGTALLYPRYLFLGLTVALQTLGLIWAISRPPVDLAAWSSGLVQFGASLLMCSLIFAYQRQGIRRLMQSRAASLHAQQQLKDQMHDRATLQEQAHSNRQLAALGRFGGGLLHDFNNILMPIMGNASILRDSDLDSRQKQRVNDILTAVERASQLSRQVRALIGPPGNRIEQIDFTTTVRDLVQGIGRTLPSGASVELAPFDELLLLRGNQAQLQRALAGLLIGLVERYQALPASVEGAPDPESVSQSNSRFRLVLARSATREECTLQIIVSAPTGATPVDSTERLAANLEQAHRALQALGGRLEFTQVQSQRWHKLAELPSKAVPQDIEINGYLIVLPLTLTTRSGEQQVTAVDDQSTIRKRSRPAARPKTRGAPPLALVVDDESALREITASMLTEAGYRCAAAASGAMAIEFCQETHPAVVIMDLRMPGLSGREAAEQIRALHPGLPIVISTGYDSQPLDWIADQQPMVLLTKPFKADELLAAVSAVVARAPQSA